MDFGGIGIGIGIRMDVQMNDVAVVAVVVIAETMHTSAGFVRRRTTMIRIQTKDNIEQLLIDQFVLLRENRKGARTNFILK